MLKKTIITAALAGATLFAVAGTSQAASQSEYQSARSYGQSTVSHRCDYFKERAQCTGSRYWWKKYRWCLNRSW